LSHPPASSTSPDLTAVDDIEPMARETVCLKNLKAIILLGGAVRSTALSEAIERSVLDLPIDRNTSILDRWFDHATGLAKAIGANELTVRVIIDHTAPTPRPPTNKGLVRMSIERDPLEFRGTGGVLRDTSQDLDDDDLILVASAGQILCEPLTQLAQAMADTHGDICIVSHDDGVPSGLMLLRCGCLRNIAAVGFVDMKEQALPEIAQTHVVTVLRRSERTGHPIRTLSDYIYALRIDQQQQSGSVDTDPMAEDWAMTFSLIEDPTCVESSARVHDSVVLVGGRVESGGVLVRSIVCPGGVVGRDAMVVDQLVRSSEKPSTRNHGGNKGR